MERNKLFFTLMLLFLISIQLSSQSKHEIKAIQKLSKYKYMLPKTPLDEFDSAPIFKPEDLELIEYFDNQGKRLKTEKYRNGKLISMEIFNENKEFNQNNSGVVRDTIKEENDDFDPKSIYGVVKKTLDKIGLQSGQLDEKYEAKYNSNGDLIEEYIISMNGDTISNFKHYYCDSNVLTRTEAHDKGNLKNTRVYLRGGANENWDRIFLFGEKGEIISDEWTKFYNVSPLIKKSTTILKWGGENGGQSIRNAIFFMDDKGKTNKAVYEVNDEILVIEFKYE